MYDCPVSFGGCFFWDVRLHFSLLSSDIPRSIESAREEVAIFAVLTSVDVMPAGDAVVEVGEGKLGASTRKATNSCSRIPAIKSNRAATPLSVGTDSEACSNSMAVPHE